MSKLTAREKKAIVKNIRLCRKRLYSERGGGNRLAKELGISPQLLSQWTKGVRAPTLEKLIALAGIFNVSIQELCGKPEPIGQNDNLCVHDAIILLSGYIRKNGRGQKARKDLAKIKSIVDNMLSDIRTREKH